MRINNTKNNKYNNDEFIGLKNRCDLVQLKQSEIYYTHMLTIQGNTITVLYMTII